jgi:hypothetical protein
MRAMRALLPHNTRTLSQILRTIVRTFTSNRTMGIYVIKQQQQQQEITQKEGRIATEND